MSIWKYLFSLDRGLVHTLLVPACEKLVGQSHSGDLYLAGMGVAAEVDFGPEALKITGVWAARMEKSFSGMPINASSKFKFVTTEKI